MPTGGLALSVLQGEAEDGLALLNGIFALLFALESGVDGVKGPRRGKLFCIERVVSLDVASESIVGGGDDGVTCQHVPSLRDMVKSGRFGGRVWAFRGKVRGWL